MEKEIKIQQKSVALGWSCTKHLRSGHCYRQAHMAERPSDEDDKKRKEKCLSLYTVGSTDGLMMAGGWLLVDNFAGCVLLLLLVIRLLVTVGQTAERSLSVEKINIIERWVHHHVDGDCSNHRSRSHTLSLYIAKELNIVCAIFQAVSFLLFSEAIRNGHGRATEDQ